MIKNWKKFNEDVYWGSENIYETDSELKERIEKWVIDWTEEVVGSDIINISVDINDPKIIVYYNKENRMENRGSSMSEENKRNSKLEWVEMAEQMVEDMKLEENSDRPGLGLSEKDYQIGADHNGYTVSFNKEFPRDIKGQW